jgi:hypothetical protein
MDTIVTLASALTVIGFVYGFLRNFKADINGHIGRLENRMDKLDHRMDTFEHRIISLEERMFWMATGKKIEDAILEDRIKREK